MHIEKITAQTHTREEDWNQDYNIAIMIMLKKFHERDQYSICLGIIIYRELSGRGTLKQCFMLLYCADAPKLSFCRIELQQIII